MRIDDFNGNNFDHTGLGFIRGGTVGCSGDGAPLSRMDIIPPDVPSWGKEYKEYFMRYYTRTFDIHMAPETLPRRDNCVDLDPRRRDRWGLPLPRVTFAFHENEKRMHLFLADIGERIFREAGAAKVGHLRPAPSACGHAPGADPKNSVSTVTPVPRRAESFHRWVFRFSDHVRLSRHGNDFGPRLPHSRIYRATTGLVSLRVIAVSYD